MPNPYHVRLAISQYGNGFRAELFTEDLGDTDGELLPPNWRESFEQWMAYLEGGGKLSAETDEKIGAELFNWLLSGSNRLKWVEVNERLKRESTRPLRLLIDSSTLASTVNEDSEADKIHNLPYGLLFDTQSHYFLFRPRSGTNIRQYVRIVRRSTPRLLNLSRTHWPLHVLVAIAEPRGLEFDGKNQLGKLLQGWAKRPDVYAVWVCTPDGPRPLAELFSAEYPLTQEILDAACRSTAEQLATALATRRYDLLHLMAHGRGGGLLLCGEDGRPAEVRTQQLAEWCNPVCVCVPSCPGRCKENPRVQMAFLQVCKAARTGGRGAFGGLAKGLLNPEGCDLAAVVASPYLLESSQSTEAALAFYEHLADGDLPDRALRRDLAMSNFGWAFLELWVRPSALGDSGTRGTFQFVSPYCGLSTFQERDADIFFGREAEVAELQKMLTQERLVAVVGDSGSGKSSLLQAGLVHTVANQGLADRTGWRTVSIKPGTEPARSLMVGLKSSEGGVARDLPTPANWLGELNTLLAASCSEERPLLLVFDQFEEMFTLCKDQEQRQAVAQALASLARDTRQHARVVLGMRSDYVGSAVTLPGLGALITRPWVLRPPGADAVRAIVARPAEVYHYRFEEAAVGGNPERQKGLLERILSDPLLSGEATGKDNSVSQVRISTPLPLLEFALEQLWLKAVERGSQEFSHDDYEDMGGLGGAIAQHARVVYERLPLKFSDRRPDSQRLAEFIFTSVVSTAGTRRPRVRAELVSAAF